METKIGKPHLRHFVTLTILNKKCFFYFNKKNIYFVYCEKVT